MFSSNSTTTRNLVLNRFEKAALSSSDLDFGTNDAVEAKLRCVMSEIYQRNESLVFEIVDTLELHAVYLGEVVSILLKAIRRKVCWYTIVCLCVIIETAAKRMPGELDRDECYQVAELVASKTREWTDNQWWIGSFLFKFQPTEVQFEQRIFNRFLASF
jgi:hypothetical protein